MKQAILIIILVGTATLHSCNDVLNTKPQDTYTEEDVWTNYSLSEGFIFSCYANCVPLILGWDADAITNSIMVHPWGNTYVKEKSEQITRNDDEGWDLFGKIRSVNLVISKMKKAPFSAAQKNILAGEAYFLRAAIYSSLVFKFGGVQLVRNTLTPETNFKIPRSSLRETYDFVIADLDTAASLLPATADRGRATRAAAYALQMRVSLQGGAYLNDNSYYRKVRSAGDALFANAGHNLDDYSNLFSSYSTAIASPENILVLERKGVNTTFQDTPMQYIACNTEMVPSKLTPEAMAKFPLKESIDGWLNYAPTQDLVDDYLVTDMDGKEKKWDKTSYFTNGNNVYKKMYRNRDKRFYVSIVYDSSKCFNNVAYLRADGNCSFNMPPLNGGDIVDGASRTGYLFAKYLYQQAKLWYSTSTDFCYSVLRLGEAYLNYAEASFRLGDEATAQVYMVKTYKIHGGFSNDITTNGIELWNAYKRERHVEMILENGDRYRSLLRWGMQISGGLKDGYENSGFVIPELNSKIRGIAIDAKGKTYQFFETGDKGGVDLRFTPKRYLFPVPFSKIQANPLLTQNAGW